MQGKAPRRETVNKITRRDGQSSSILVTTQNNNAKLPVRGAPEARTCLTEDDSKHCKFVVL